VIRRSRGNACARDALRTAWVVKRAPNEADSERADYFELIVGTRRFRPFARRRFKTVRPAFVLMRVRKPCVRLRRMRLGWNVRFIREFLGRGGSAEKGARSYRPRLLHVKPSLDSASLQNAEKGTDSR
jgi:hypothetical protein